MISMHLRKLMLTYTYTHKGLTRKAAFTDHFSVWVPNGSRNAGILSVAARPLQFVTLLDKWQSPQLPHHNPHIEMDS